MTTKLLIKRIRHLLHRLFVHRSTTKIATDILVHSEAIDQIHPSLVDKVSSISNEVRKSHRSTTPAVPPFQKSVRVARRKSVSILTWSVSHNAFGRAYLIADALRDDYEVELIAPSFSQFGHDIWSPVRGCNRVRIKTYQGVNFPHHFHHLQHMAKHVTGDAIYVSKPRLPGLELAILAKLERDRPIILDVDDYEVGFFKNRDPVTLEGVKAQQEGKEFSCPYGELWTRYSDSLIDQFDALTVSTSQLQARHGGTVLPHMRDEVDFAPTSYPREKIRRALGFNHEDRVVLFAGTPRPHKGIDQIIRAIENLGEHSYKLLLIGSPLDKITLSFLHSRELHFLRTIDCVPFSDLPAYLCASDLICLIQNEVDITSRYQMPAKFTDGLSMQIPMVASNVPAFEDLAKDGLVELLGDTSLEDKIGSIFRNYAHYKARAVRNRAMFLETYSYEANRPRLRNMIDSAMIHPRSTSTELRDLVAYHRELFAETDHFPPQVHQISARDGATDQCRYTSGPQESRHG